MSLERNGLGTAGLLFLVHFQYGSFMMNDLLVKYYMFNYTHIMNTVKLAYTITVNGLRVIK